MTSHETQSTSKRARLALPVSFKIFLTVASALVPMGIVLGIYADIFPLPPMGGIQSLLHGTISYFGITVSNAVIVFYLTLFISVVISLLVAESLFLRRLHLLLGYIDTIRASGFKKLPVLPPLGNDEIGRLAMSVGFASIQFQGMREKYDTADDQRSLFLMTAAHQLRTPLSELIWAIDDIRSAKGTVAEKEDLLVAVDGTLRRMRLIIEHLLAGAGIEDGKFGYVFESVDPNAVIRKVVDELKPEAERRNIDLQVAIEGTLFPVRADLERVSLLLFDLVSNAINYTPPKGTVTVSAKARPGRIEVSVADTGIGISKEEQASLFNKFYRSERARHMHPDGSGLGLYLANNIAQKHGSDLIVDSVENKGTKMTFYLNSI